MEINGIFFDYIRKWKKVLIFLVFDDSFVLFCKGCCEEEGKIFVGIAF